MPIWGEDETLRFVEGVRYARSHAHSAPVLSGAGFVTSHAFVYAPKNKIKYDFERATMMLPQRSFLALLVAASFPITAIAQQTSTVPAAVPTAVPAPSVVVVVPTGTRVPVSTTDKISSATAQVGDIITIAATEDVIANGYIVVARGAGGQAEIATVERAHGNGGSGKLGIKMDWITAVDGEKIVLTSTLKTASEEDRGGGSSTATILSYALLGPLGLFFHNFSHGKDVILDPSKVLTAFVDTTVHIAATTPAQQTGFAH